MKKYDNYKESGIEWLGKIPEDWEVVKLKHIVDSVETGKTPSTTIEEYFENGHIDWYSPGDFTSLKLGDSNKKITDLAVIENKLSLYPINTILLIGIGATLGKVAVTDRICFTNQQINAIIPSGKMDPFFGLYYLDSIKDVIRNESNASTMAILNQSKTKDLIFIKPSLHEQTTIASYLDHKTTQIDSLIEKKEKLIEKLKLQRQAIINEAVTKGLNPDAPMKDSGIEWLGKIPKHWEVIQMRHCFSFTKGLSITKENLSDSGIPCVNYGEIHSKYGFEVNPQENELGCVSEDFMHTNENALLSKGNFVFADTSEDIDGSGNFTYLNSETPTFAGYHTIIARLKTSKEYRFFAYLFDSLVFRTQIREQVKGVKVFSITNKILRGTLLFSPPEKEKEEITNHIDNKTRSIFEAIQKLQESIEKLKLYRQSIISEAVTGKIDVRDWKKPEKK